MPVVMAKTLTDGSISECEFSKKENAEFYDEDLDVYLCAFCKDITGKCLVCHANRGKFYYGVGHLCSQCIQTIKGLNP